MPSSPSTPRPSHPCTLHTVRSRPAGCSMAPLGQSPVVYCPRTSTLGDHSSSTIVRYVERGWADQHTNMAQSVLIRIAQASVVGIRDNFLGTFYRLNNRSCHRQNIACLAGPTTLGQPIGPGRPEVLLPLFPYTRFALQLGLYQSIRGSLLKVLWAQF